MGPEHLCRLRRVLVRWCEAYGADGGVYVLSLVAVYAVAAWFKDLDELRAALPRHRSTFAGILKWASELDEQWRAGERNASHAVPNPEAVPLQGVEGDEAGLDPAACRLLLKGLLGVEAATLELERRSA